MLTFPGVGISLNIYLTTTGKHLMVRVLTNISLGLTITFNIILTFLISARLITARRAMLVMGEPIKGLESHYTTLINIVVESVAIWILSAILYLACLNAFEGRCLDADDPPNFSALLPVFQSLFRVTSVRYCYWKLLLLFRFLQALCPALILYQTANPLQYRPDAISKRLSPVQQTEIWWLYDTENQIVRMEKSKGLAWDAGTESPIPYHSKTSMRYVIMFQYKPTTCLI
jgi:hypothetical protein